MEGFLLSSQSGHGYCVGLLGYCYYSPRRDFLYISLCLMRPFSHDFT